VRPDGGVICVIIEMPAPDASVPEVQYRAALR
jgi:hypothetical protein